MTEKVALPEEVAEGIEQLRAEGVRDFAIMHLAKGALTSEPDVTIRKWAFDEDGKGSPELLMQALVNGYEVEKSPEEKLRESYEKFREAMVYSYEHGIADGIRRALNTLGITIEGINDK